MKGISDFTERRQHERTCAQKLVVVILNPDDPVAFGLINDISLGGIKFTHELRISPFDNPIKSVDLIADSLSLNDIPCEYVWNVDEQQTPDVISEDFGRGRIKFGKLTPEQIFLLKSLIKHCRFRGSRSKSSIAQITCN